MNAHVLHLFHGHRFLGGRAVANRVRNEAESLLRADRSAVVLLDFTGVQGVSHSFADELLTPLNELLCERLSARVFLSNCSTGVREGLEMTASMHGLVMPAAAPYPITA
jgi:hypothetical protein